MKLQIYAGEPIERLMTLDPGLTRSGRINAAIGAYLEMIEDELKRLDLTLDEWYAISTCSTTRASAAPSMRRGTICGLMSWRVQR
jgi:hypothetical protein